MLAKNRTHMPWGTSEEYERQTPTTQNYDTDPLWLNKPLTPSQLLVHDIRLEALRGLRAPRLEVNERQISSLVPATAGITPPASHVRAAHATNNPIEKQKFSRLEEDYGWMRYLRLENHQLHRDDNEDSAKCRWVHCSSKFPEYLAGFLWAFSDDRTSISRSMRLLDHAVQRQTRFSQHGKYFAPFFQPLRVPTANKAASDIYPTLISVPFLDWTIQGETPPLRFQVDRREGFVSARSSVHLLRSILQYFYRLEDTTDRERSQVFAKHKPWTTNRELDLKVRQWYGHYPSGLNVDELWILAVDAEHIVTISSNQTWKSRWPPLQLTSRISDVAFRGLRNQFFTENSDQEYTAMTHVIACLDGAVGMMHRNFWPDMVLCLTDRYAGYLGHLQYRLHRSPSTKLVMDLIACQEELNIVVQITRQQIDMIAELSPLLRARRGPNDSREAPSPISQSPTFAVFNEYDDFEGHPVPPQRQTTLHRTSSADLMDPASQLIDNLQRELVDLQDLRDNTDRLVTRTIQLVNIRMEDHGKAILVFTLVTIIFLPLNFVSSFFGMNVSDIRNMTQNQSLFWTVALCVTVGVGAASTFLAFSGADILEKIRVWRDSRRERERSTSAMRERQTITSNAEHTVRVHLKDRVRH